MLLLATGGGKTFQQDRTGILDFINSHFAPVLKDPLISSAFRTHISCGYPSIWMPPLLGAMV
jgi:hypothetical protein